MGAPHRSALLGAGVSDRRGVNRSVCGELSDRRAVDGSVIRVVGASLGPAVGTGVAVGIEVRSALHRSGQVRPLVGGSPLNIVFRVDKTARHGRRAWERQGLSLVFFLIMCVACSMHPVPLGRDGDLHWKEA